METGTEISQAAFVREQITEPSDIAELPVIRRQANAKETRNAFVMETVDIAAFQKVCSSIPMEVERLVPSSLAI